jgi:hypothetical protein
MTNLFAEIFVVPTLPGDSEEVATRYDEDRALNVLPDGRPVIEMGHAGGTVTLTEAGGESDDNDPPGDDRLFALTTVTKVKAERDDFARTTNVSTTTATRVRDEADDVDRDARASECAFTPGTLTHTSVKPEADDSDRAARSFEGAVSCGTVSQTFVRAESEDADRDARIVNCEPTTKTAVKAEADDFWSEADPGGRPAHGFAWLVP